MMQNSKDTRDAQAETYLPPQTLGGGGAVCLKLQCHQLLEAFRGGLCLSLWLGAFLSSPSLLVV